MKYYIDYEYQGVVHKFETSTQSNYDNFTEEMLLMEVKTLILSNLGISNDRNITVYNVKMFKEAGALLNKKVIDIISTRNIVI